MLPGAGGTTEGQWEMNGTTFMAEYFYITDHLGNNRVSVKNEGGTPLVTGKTDYYPYGSVSREWTTSTENLRKFKYQQKVEVIRNPALDGNVTWKQATTTLRLGPMTARLGAFYRWIRWQ
ncbi:MAG: hypothetical protein HUU10_14155 [Bacteroidetes bacterium]|nr:hypothetical protein [Bacteroidota bacterium]